MKAAAWFLALLFAAAGCGGSSYSHTDVSAVDVGNQLPGTVTPQLIKVPVATVVQAHIAPYNSDGNPMVGAVVSDDPNTLAVLNGQGDKNYALLGVHEGTSHLRLLADGVLVVTVAATVSPQQ